MQSITLNGLNLETVELVVDGKKIDLAEAFRLVEAERAKATAPMFELNYAEATLSHLRGDNTKQTFRAMFELIRKNGAVTLEEVAAQMGQSVDSVRAHLRNGRRSLKARNWDFPFNDEWVPEHNCVNYTIGGLYPKAQA
jgi:ribosome-associated translation inhibitor RaiA